MQTNEPMTLQRRLVWLRWWFLGVLAFAAVAVPGVLKISLPLFPIFLVLVLLGIFNALNYWRTRVRVQTATDLVAQLCVDLCGLGVLLYLSGGAANPLVSLLLFPVAVAALSLPGRWVAAITLASIAAYSFLMHFFLPLEIVDIERASHLHLMGMWLTFVVSALIAAWFITRMTASIRARDAALADAREQALRGAQVVAMGQLAAGAAHELGTPLATMHLLAGELLQDMRMPQDLREDVVLLRKQVLACKEIISGLISRAGIERAGSVRRVVANDWLNGVLMRWRTLWPHAQCDLQIAGVGDMPQVGVEATLEQAVINLLNNAAKHGSGALSLRLSWNAEHVHIAVHDRGPGFDAIVLQRGGVEPLMPSADGSGIGLWLTRTAVEKAGGVLHLENTQEGAAVTISLHRLRDE